VTNPGLDLSELQGSCVAMHEMFTSLVAAGFSEDQALRLIAAMVAEQQRQQP
jgi:hypothetical protein